MFMSLTFLEKNSIVKVRLGFKYASDDAQSFLCVFVCVCFFHVALIVKITG